MYILRSSRSPYLINSRRVPVERFRLRHEVTGWHIRGATQVWRIIQPCCACWDHLRLPRDTRWRYNRVAIVRMAQTTTPTTTRGAIARPCDRGASVIMFEMSDSVPTTQPKQIADEINILRTNVILIAELRITNASESTSANETKSPDHHLTPPAQQSRFAKTQNTTPSTNTPYPTKASTKTRLICSRALPAAPPSLMQRGDSYGLSCIVSSLSYGYLVPTLSLLWSYIAGRLQFFLSSSSPPAKLNGVLYLPPIGIVVWA